MPNIDVALEEQLAALVEVVEADAVALRGSALGLEGVAHDDGVVLRGDTDGEGVVVGNDVVLDGVLDEQLEADGDDGHVEAAGVDMLGYLEVAAVADGHHVDVGLREFQLFAEGNVLGLPHDVAVGGGELVEVLVGFVVFEPDEAVEGVEGVEEEVGVDLVFERLVADEEVLGAEVLVFDFYLLAAGDVGEQHRDEEGGGGEDEVFGDVEPEEAVVEGLVIYPDADGLRGTGAAQGDAEGAETGGEEGLAAGPVALHDAEVEDEEHPEEDEVEHHLPHDVEAGAEDVVVVVDVAQQEESGEDDASHHGEPKGIAGGEGVRDADMFQVQSQGRHDVLLSEER